MKCQGLFPLFEVNEEGVIFWSLVLKNCWLPSQVLYDIICYINIAGWQCGTRHITTMMNKSWFVDTISYRSHNWRIIAAVFPSDILYSLTNFTLSILVVTLQITEQNHHKFPNKKDGALQQLLKKLGNCTSNGSIITGPDIFCFSLALENMIYDNTTLFRCDFTKYIMKTVFSGEKKAMRQGFAPSQRDLIPRSEKKKCKLDASHI